MYFRPLLASFVNFYHSRALNNSNDHFIRLMAGVFNLHAITCR